MNFLISSFDPMDETSMDLGLNFTMRQRWQAPRLGPFRAYLANAFLTKLQAPIPPIFPYLRNVKHAILNWS